MRGMRKKGNGFGGGRGNQCLQKGRESNLKDRIILSEIIALLVFRKNFVFVTP